MLSAAESSTRALTSSGRISYARIDEKLPIPNLIELQLDSFAWFVDKGLRELFDEISPIKDFTGKVMELQFLDYEFGPPKYNELECRTKDLTFSRPLYVNVELLGIAGRVHHHDGLGHPARRGEGVPLGPARIDRALRLVFRQREMETEVGPRVQVRELASDKERTRTRAGGVGLQHQCTRARYRHAARLLDDPAQSERPRRQIVADGGIARLLVELALSLGA